MKRIVNVRLPVLAACTLALGEVAAYLFRYLHIDLFFILAAIPVSAVFFIVFFALRKRKPLAYSVVAALAFAVGFLDCYLRLYNYGLCDIESGKLYYITGKVIEKGATKNGEYIILSGATADGYNLSGKIIAYLGGEYGEFCDLGYKVQFSSTLNIQDLFTYGSLNANAEENVKYSCSALGGVRSEYGFSLFGSIRSTIRNTLYSNLDKGTAAVCYGMLVGDTDGVDAETMSAFRYGGIAHIFAVSGLHIGIVYGIVGGICKRLHANKFAGAAICFSFILFYSAICGFTLSSVRAVIMCSVSILSRLLRVKRDGLNSLAIAVILILLITPLSLFSVGFQLSVCAVGGITIFSKAIVKASSKIKIPKFISDKYATTFGAQLGTLPVLASSFGYISGAGLLLNLIIIPVLSFAFVLIFLATFLSLVIPAAGVILPSAVVPLEATLSFVLDMGLEKSLLSGFGAGLFPLIYYIGILCISDKINLGVIARSVGFVVLCCALVAYVLIRTFSPFEGHEIIVSGSYSGGSVLIKSNGGTVLIITEYASPSKVNSSLNENYADRPNAVILLCGQEFTAQYGYQYDFDCRDIYISNLYFPAQPDEKFTFHYEHYFNLYGIEFEFIDQYSVAFVCDGVSVAVCSADYMRVNSCDLLISQQLNYNPATHGQKCEAKNTVYFSQKGQIYNTYDYGEMKFKTKDGLLKFASPPVKH